MVPKQVLLEQDAKVAYFVESGTVSMLQTLDDGTRIEVGLVGPEGFVGIPLLLGDETAAVEDGAGRGRSPADAGYYIPEAAHGAAGICQAVVALYRQLPYLSSQTAACNGRHQVEQRLARWLLMTHDRNAGDRFTMMQEFMSTPARRSAARLTVAIGALQRVGLVEHGRGAVTVVDRAGLEAASCECYEVVRRRFAWLCSAKASTS